MQNAILCIILFLYIYNKIIIYIAKILVIDAILKIIFFSNCLQIFSESNTTNQYKKLFNQGLQGLKMYYL